LIKLQQINRKKRKDNLPVNRNKASLSADSVEQIHAHKFGKLHEITKFVIFERLKFLKLKFSMVVHSGAQAGGS
jgi:hypothetical protein